MFYVFLKFRSNCNDVSIFTVKRLPGTVSTFNGISTALVWVFFLGTKSPSSCSQATSNLSKQSLMSLTLKLSQSRRVLIFQPEDSLQTLFIGVIFRVPPSAKHISSDFFPTAHAFCDPCSYAVLHGNVSLDFFWKLWAFVQVPLLSDARGGALGPDRYRVLLWRWRAHCCEAHCNTSARVKVPLSSPRCLVETERCWLLSPPF